METLATKIRLFRDANRLTQTEMAKILGVTRMAVAFWENGSHIPSTRNLVKINAIMNRWFTQPQAVVNASAPVPSHKCDAMPTLSSLRERADKLTAELQQVEALIEAYRAGMAEAVSRAQESNNDNQLTA